MTNSIRIGTLSTTPHCDNCSGTLITTEDNPTDDFIVKCEIPAGRSSAVSQSSNLGRSNF